MKQTQHTPTRWWMQALAVLVLVFACGDVRAATSAPDLDGDGIPNIVDPDVDNDGLPNATDRNIDGGIAKTGPYAGQYIGDHIENENPAEKDIDDDGLADDSLAEKDIDGDGKLDDDAIEDDIDGDNRKDDSTAERDIDGDGKDDESDEEDDIDGDGLDDDDDLEHDIDGDDKLDGTDDDIDGDGRQNGSASELDTDGDGLTDDDTEENDDDGDGVQDRNDDDDDNDGTGDLEDSDHHPEDGEDETTVHLTLLPAAPNDAKAHVTYKVLGSGSAKFTVDARDLALGNYEFVVDGTVRGTLSIVPENSKTRGILIFRTGTNLNGATLLDFIVAEKPVIIRQGSVEFFNGTAPPAPTSTETGGIGTGSVQLTAAPGVSNQAHADAEIDFEAAGPGQLQLQIENLPIGSYSVLIGEALRGTVNIVSTPNGPRGVLVFKKQPTGAQVLLDFAIAGQSISIAQGSSTFFFGQLPAAATP